MAVKFRVPFSASLGEGLPTFRKIVWWCF